MRERVWARSTLALIAVLFVVNTSATYLASFRYGAHDVAREPRHAEMLAYVQTSEDLVRSLAAVDRAKQRVAPGSNVITVAGESVWPLSWYLRDVPVVGFPDRPGLDRRSSSPTGTPKRARKAARAEVRRPARADPRVVVSGGSHGGQEDPPDAQ